MAKQKAPKKEKSVVKEEIIQEPEVEIDSKHLENQNDRKMSFGKVTYHGGIYILAFENSIDRDYCECNALEFKHLNEKDIKQDKVHIWECGAKTPEAIDKLPIVDLNKFREKALKEKEAKKLERAEKRQATIKARIK